MAFSSIAIALLSIGYPVYLFVASFIRERRFRAFARVNGCLPAYNDDSSWPWGLDRLYSMITARKNGRDPMDDYFSPPLFEHSTLERTGLGGTKLLETIEPENIKTILATDFKNWEIGHMRNTAFQAVLGTNVFTSDGAVWEHSRAMLRPQFARDKINDLESTERELSTLFQAIEIGGVGKDGWTSELDLLPLIFRFVLDNATEFLFGESVGSQKAMIGGKETENRHEPKDISKVAGGAEFAEAVETASYYMVLRIRLQPFIFLGTSETFRKACQTMRSVPEYYIQKALTGDRNLQTKRFDLLSVLVEKTQDSAELRDQALGLLFAGRDTTSSLLVWTLLLLGQHPNVLRRLRQVILESFPSDGSLTLDFNQLKSCRYLQHVFQESLRLYAIVPLNSRVALRDTVLPVGGGPDGSKPVAVRKGQQVLWNTYAMHRRQDYWGADVLEYNPDRWEDPKHSRLLGGGWAFLPFSGGPRICLGQQYALTEASYCIVRLLQRYDMIELAPDSAAAKREHIKKSIGVSMAPIELRLRLHKA